MGFSRTALQFSIGWYAKESHFESVGFHRIKKKKNEEDDDPCAVEQILLTLERFHLCETNVYNVHCTPKHLHFIFGFCTLGVFLHTTYIYIFHLYPIHPSLFSLLLASYIQFCPYLHSTSTWRWRWLRMQTDKWPFLPNEANNLIAKMINFCVHPNKMYKSIPSYSNTNNGKVENKQDENLTCRSILAIVYICQRTHIPNNYFINDFHLVILKISTSPTWARVFHNLRNFHTVWMKFQRRPLK